MLAGTAGAATGATRTAAPSPASIGSTRIAYSAGGEIRTIAASGGGSRAIAAGESPSWSPDGRQLVFQSARNGPDEDVWLTYADGSNQRRVVTHVTRDDNDDSREDFDPAWSPVDDRIAFVSNRNGDNDIWLTNSIGHSTGDLTRDSAASDKSPAWSPDGTAIAFVSDREGNDDIYTMRLDGSGVTRLAASAASDEGPAWSPDGSEIAFQSLRDGNWEIYVVGVDGSRLRRLTTNPAEDTAPAWSPDGTAIVFASGRGGGSRLHVVPRGGDDARELATSEDAATPDWQPASDLAVTASSAPARRGVGRVRFTVSERTPLPSLRAALTIRMPRAARAVAVRPSLGACTGTALIRCSFGTLKAAAPASVDVQWISASCSPGFVVARASGLRVDIDHANDRRTQKLRVVCPKRYAARARAA